jgi:hypothetical protein
LIENSDTLDATTRQHVAFVVFYGDHSGVVREGNVGYWPHRNRAQPGNLRVRLDGLSISGDPYFQSEVVVEPTMPPQPERGLRLQRNHELFSDELGDFFRSSPENVNRSFLARHMSRVATRLMEIYDIRESRLPCLLFTDGNNFKKHLIVQLDPHEPLDSLYKHVLRPLSDQFSPLSHYWERRDNYSWKKRWAQWAADAAVKLAAEIANVTAEIERQNQIIPEQIRMVHEKINKLEKARQEKLSEQGNVARQEKLSEQGKVVQELEEERRWTPRKRKRISSVHSLSPANNKPNPGNSAQQ